MLTALMLAGLLRAAQPVAEEAPIASPDALAFGLDKLAWGMNTREAARRYPALDGAAPEAGEVWSALSWNGFGYGGCVFTVNLNFEHGRLSEVELDSVGTQGLERCGAKIKSVLARQYGKEPGGFSTASNPRGFSEYAAWRGPVTEVTYGALKDGFIEIHFTATPQR